MTMIFLVSLSVLALTATALDISQQDFPEFIGLMSRDVEALPGPLAFGHKYMTGGAGEGSQQLLPESDFEEREQVKSDSVLPAYCEPPNPCPLGYTAADGCLEEFENTAEFSRNYQASQSCICDQEHMFNCPDKRSDNDLEESLESILNHQGLHKTLIAKKFHKKRSHVRAAPNKRSLSSPVSKLPTQNPYFRGEILKSVMKKDGRNTWQYE